jgi:hypothetical protein
LCVCVCVFATAKHKKEALIALLFSCCNAAKGGPQGGNGFAPLQHPQPNKELPPLGEELFFCNFIGSRGSHITNGWGYFTPQIKTYTSGAKQHLLNIYLNTLLAQIKYLK